MFVVLTVLWTRHTKFKKNQINGKPLFCVNICVLVSIQNNKLRLRPIFWKSVHINELSTMNIHSFEAKWRVLLPDSWHSLLKYAHIRHKRASWYHEQCCRRKFSFSFHKKINFYFPKVKNGYFCEASTKTMLQNCSDTFKTNTRPYFIYEITKWLFVKCFHQPLV